jgi:protoporphyrinogen oxidase
MPNSEVVILGAGPAGLGAAYKLTQARRASVTLLEQNDRVGGNAGSFELAGGFVDYGSHRLHPACDPEVLGDIRSLLGDDLKYRPRHGRIRLQGRWIHFPLKPLDLALRLPPTFILGVARDGIGKTLARNGHGDSRASFASVMENGLGRTIYRDFYGPYAWKIWGENPQELSPIQAQRRVSAGSLAKMARKILSAVPGLKPPGTGRFYYPRRGFGQISEAYYRAAVDGGAQVRFKARVKAVEACPDGSFRVEFDQDGQAHLIEAGTVWSTIPITILARGLKPSPPADILESAAAIDTRAMILIYLILEQDRFSEYDAHYFPDRDIPITRLSEPKNYSASQEPRGRTVLCAELPCSPQDRAWNESEEALGQLVCAALDRAGIPVRSPIQGVAVRRLRNAYPIYRLGYEAHFQRLDEWIGAIPGLLTFGRQGLFAHDNTHHALFMAYCAAACIDAGGRFDQGQWEGFRRIFETHVVED